MTDDDIRRIIHRIVITGSGDDDVDDRMDLEIFRAGMEEAARICNARAEQWHSGQYVDARNEADGCAAAIRAAANGPPS